MRIRIKYSFCLLLVTLVLGSCRERHDPAAGNDFGGLYKITDLKSDLALDLNNDGISSCDLYAEITNPFHSLIEGPAPFSYYDFEERNNYAEVRPAFAGQVDRRLILPNLPFQEIYYVQTEPELDFYAHDLGYYEYTLTRTPRVELRLVNPGTIRLGTIDRLERTGTDSFEIGMTGRLFDFAIRKWTDVSLIVTYHRVEPSDL